MISLCTGLIAAIFSYIRTELRLNQNLETIRETACMEHLQELDREDTGGGSIICSSREGHGKDGKNICSRTIYVGNRGGLEL